MEQRGTRLEQRPRGAQKQTARTSLVAQWLGIYLAMQGTRVWTQVGESKILWHRATKPGSANDQDLMQPD